MVFTSDDDSDDDETWMLRRSTPKLRLESSTSNDEDWRFGGRKKLVKAKTTSLESPTELQKTRKILENAIERETRLRQELSLSRTDAAARESKLQARINLLEADLTVTNDQVEATKAAQRKLKLKYEMQRDVVIDLESQVQQLTRTIAALEVEKNGLQAQLVKETRLRHDTVIHGDQLNVIVKELRHDLAAIKSDTSLSDSMAQMQLDNDRLVRLLADTQEFNQFKMYTSLEQTSYCSPESIRAGKDLLAWGRLVASLKDRYPTHADDSNAIVNIATEEKNWVPTQVLMFANAFRCGPRSAA
ncbi:hypothetical protein AC1031_011047 [Aphanomyces cochlioides]|nr:hypothetical protein AC1031_011047 [Aphanomyces cochlioides]